MLKLDIKVDLMSYGDKTQSLIKDFELSINQGEIVALLGPSGIGKSTLLRIIAGLEQSFDGRITFGGKVIDRPHKEIQVVFQDYRLLPWRNVGENIALADHGQEMKDSQQINYWIKTMGLEGKKDVWPKTLSGGQKSRVALARAFYAKPKVLLLDEPFQSLDIATKYPIMRELRKILREQKITTVIVTHTVEDAVYLADTIYTLNSSPLTVMSRRSIHRDGDELKQTDIVKLTEDINTLLLNTSRKS